MDTVSTVTFRRRANALDALEHQIRRNVLLGLLAELYERKPSDAISVKEWLENKLAEEECEAGDEKRA